MIGDHVHSFYEEINLLFGTIASVAWVCLLVALIILAGAATRWFVANTSRST